MSSINSRINITRENLSFELRGALVEYYEVPLLLTKRIKVSEYSSRIYHFEMIKIKNVCLSDCFDSCTSRITKKKIKSHISNLFLIN